MQLLLQFLQILPALIQVVIHVEQAVTAQGAGVSKLELIKLAIQTVAEQEKTIPSDKLIPLVEKYVGGVVTVLNKTGVFKTSQ